MNDLLGWILWSWLILLIGFVAGCWWNGSAYDRGRSDESERWSREWINDMLTFAHVYPDDLARLEGRDPEFRSWLAARVESSDKVRPIELPEFVLERAIDKGFVVDIIVDRSGDAIARGYNWLGTSSRDGANFWRYEKAGSGQ